MSLRGGAAVASKSAADTATSILALDLEAWVATTSRLLALEQEAGVNAASEALSRQSEADRAAQGVSLRLVVDSVSTGLMARTTLTLAPRNGLLLPNHSFSSGDVVGVVRVGTTVVPGSSRDAYDASAVVVSVLKGAITVALDDSGPGRAEGSSNGGEPLSMGDAVRLDKLADDVSFRRLAAALEDLKGYRHGAAGKVIRALFATGADMASGTCTPEFSEGPCLLPRESDAQVSVGAAALPPRLATWTPINAGLNESQTRAIESALRATDLCMIHGPPGTGKTTAVVEYIAQEVLRGNKVLACAPSNVAVDNMVERLAALRVSCAPPLGAADSRKRGSEGAGSSTRLLRVVRLGHPARLAPGVLAHSLEARVRSAEGTGIVEDVRKELASLGAQYRRARGGAERKAIRAEERQLRSEIRKREERVVAQILRGADVILATNTGAATKALRRSMLPPSSDGESGGGAGSEAFFDVVVIDEVAQATEVSCYIPAVLGRKLVVAGDHLQLPPTVISEEAARLGLSVTLADRFSSKFGGAGACERHPSLVCLLDMQYRMHADIMRWSSDALYGGRVSAAAEVAAHTLAGLPTVQVPADGVVTVSAASLTAARAASAADIADRVAEAAEAAATAAAAAAALAAAGKAAGGGGRRGHAAAGSDAAPPPPDTALAAVRNLLLPAADDVSLDAAALLSPMLLVDTAGCPGMEELFGSGSGSGASGGGTGGGKDASLLRESKSNPGEADVVLKHVLALRALGVPAADIAVVTPYNAQVALLSALLSGSGTLAGVEVRSVDSFQGQEREAIVISMVRSNRVGQVGFLADFRRMNVAVTRARRHCALVCDSDTVGSDSFLRGLVDYATEHGRVCSAAEYAPGDEAVVVVRGGGSGARDHAAAKTSRRDKGQQPRGPKGAADAGLDRKQLFLAVRSVLRQFLRLLGESGSTDISSAAQWQSLEGRRLCPADAALASVLPPAVLTPSSRDSTVRELTMHFPPALSSFQRMMVHAVATRAGLMHGSTGEGAVVRHAWVRGAVTDGGGEAEVDDDELAWAAIEEGGGHLDARDDNATPASRGVTASDAAVTPPVPSGAAAAPPPAFLSPDVSTAPSRLPADGGGAAKQDATTVAEKAAIASLPSIAVSSSVLAEGRAPASQTRAPAVGAANSLLGDLASARKARAAQAAAAATPTADEREAAELTAAVVIGAAGSSKAVPDSAAIGSKKKKKDKAVVASPPPLPQAGEAATAAVTRHGGSEKREFGLPVGGVKPVPLAGAMKVDSAGAVSRPKKKSKEKAGSDDDMALLDAMVAGSQVCSALRCKKSVLGLSTVCRHCRLRFCYEHGLPEAHGCGDAVRAAVRAAWTGGAGMASLTGEPSTATGKGAKK